MNDTAHTTFDARELVACVRHEYGTGITRHPEWRHAQLEALATMLRDHAGRFSREGSGTAPQPRIWLHNEQIGAESRELGEQFRLGRLGQPHHRHQRRNTDHDSQGRQRRALFARPHADGGSAKQVGEMEFARW